MKGAGASCFCGDADCGPDVHDSFFGFVELSEPSPVCSEIGFFNAVSTGPVCIPPMMGEEGAPCLCGDADCEFDVDDAFFGLAEDLVSPEPCDCAVADLAGSTIFGIVTDC